MARRRKVEQRPYPYEVDTRLLGVEVRIKGEHGKLSIVQRETNPRNGKTWFVLWKAGYGFRHKHPKDVTPVKRGASLA